MTNEAQAPAKANRKNIHTSYAGTFKPGSLSVENGVASAILVAAGNAAVELPVNGYKDNCKTLCDAVEAGGEVILRGTVLGSFGKGTKHLAVYGVGAEDVTGKVTNVRQNLDTCAETGKVPYVNAFVVREINGKRVAMGLQAYGDVALSLKGIASGDTISIPARQTHEQRQAPAKDGGEAKTRWESVLLATGPGKLTKAA